MIPKRGECDKSCDPATPAIQIPHKNMKSKKWGYIGGKFFAHKMWAPTAAQSFIAAHLKSLKEYPPRQGADTLSLHKAVEAAMAKMEAARTTNN